MILTVKARTKWLCPKFLLELIVIIIVKSFPLQKKRRGFLTEVVVLAGINYCFVFFKFEIFLSMRLFFVAPSYFPSTAQNSPRPPGKDSRKKLALSK